MALAGIRISGESLSTLSQVLGALPLLHRKGEGDGVRVRSDQVRWLYKLADAVRDRGRRRFWPADQASGRRAEDLAHRFLRRRGMVIVARNYRPPSGAGEIDLIGWDGDWLALDRKSTRLNSSHGYISYAVFCL